MGSHRWAEEVKVQTRGDGSAGIVAGITQAGRQAGR